MVVATMMVMAIIVIASTHSHPHHDGFLKNLGYL